MTGMIIFFAVCFVAGTLSLLYGKKMVNVLLAVYAFCAVYRFVLEHFPDNAYILWIALAAGILAIVLVKTAKKFAFFLLGAVIGLLIGMTVLIFLPELPEYVPYAVVLIFVLAFGYLTSHYENTLIRFGTAYIGGEMISSAVLLLVFGSAALPALASDDIVTSMNAVSQYLYGPFTAQYSLWIVIIGIVLMAFGAVYQKKH